MIQFEALYFDGKRSRAQPVTVFSEGAGLSVRTLGGELLLEARLGECRISDPLGHTSRTVGLPGGGALEIDDEEAALALERARGGGEVARAVHRLELRWSVAVAGVLALALGATAFVEWGVPALAAGAARALPEAVQASAGRRTLDLLDRSAFSASRLTAERARAVRSLFGRVSAAMAPGLESRLELRRSPALGPNAFALPGRLVVITDELVGLVRSDDELEGVIAHEIGHLQGRHALRAVFQRAGVFLVISALLGDVASLSSAAAALPAVLVQTGYSRAFEREADEAAGRYLLATRQTTAPLRALLLRLDEKRVELPAASLLSTHPPSKERALRLEALERR